MSIQRSEEWFLERLGHATASKFADALSKGKNGEESASRRNYKLQLVTERLTGQPSEGYSNAAMEWGTEQEPYARAAYEAYSGTIVDECGFIRHSGGLKAGASPDGLVGDNGIIEIKCPNSATHVETLVSRAMPSKYISQVQGQLWITNRDWCDFVSFDPRMPGPLQLFVVRVPRDEERIELIADGIRGFLLEVSALEAQLRSL